MHLRKGDAKERLSNHIVVLFGFTDVSVAQSLQTVVIPLQRRKISLLK